MPKVLNRCHGEIANDAITKLLTTYYKWLLKDEDDENEDK